jgi:hypothetical protein
MVGTRSPFPWRWCVVSTEDIAALGFEDFRTDWRPKYICFSIFARLAMIRSWARKISETTTHLQKKEPLARSPVGLPESSFPNRISVVKLQISLVKLTVLIPEDLDH